MNLHEAIQEVIAEEGKGLTTKEIADEINKRRLYERKDGQPVPASQISGRVRNFPSLFEKDDNNRISLLKESQKAELLRRYYRFIDKSYSSSFLSGGYAGMLSMLVFLTLYLKKAHWPLLNTSQNYWENLRVHLEEFAIELKVDGLEGLIGQLKAFFENDKVVSDWLFENQKVFHLAQDEELKEAILELLTLDKNIMRSELMSSQNISTLYGELAKRISFQSLIDPACGTGSSFFRILDQQEGSSGTAFDISPDVALIASLISILFYSERSHITSLNAFESKDLGVYDLVAFVPPFTVKVTSDEIKTKIKDLPERNRYLSEEIFAYKALELVSEEGKVIVTLPESALSSGQLKELREYLVQNQLIESIISLPAGALGSSVGIKTSILCLSKKEKSSIYYLDASHWGQGGSKTVRLESSAIAEIWSKREIIERHSFVIEYANVQSDNLSLSRLNPYVWATTVKTQVGDFLKPAILTKATEQDATLKFILIYNLSNENESGRLDTKNMETFENKYPIEKLSQFRLLMGPAILVAKVGSNLKPTLIEENQNGILVNKNILCLNVKPEYESQALAITKSMNEPEFAERIAAITIGTGVPHRANKDILDLTFRIHEFEGFESSEKKDIYEYAGDLYGLFRHDFSQPVSTLSLQYSILRKTLLKIIDSDVLSQKVKKTGKSLEELINDPAVQIKRISQILKANENLHTGVLQPQVCSLRELINESFREFNHDLLKNMSFEVRGDIEQRIDPDQIKLLFTNLIKNAVHHGGSGDINLLFELKEIEEEGMLEIRYFNNGDPFPTNFSIKDYVQPQSKGDNSNGSGHGGFIIQKVAMNHNGTVDQIWNESVPKYFNEEDGNTYNVYLHITLRPIK